MLRLIETISFAILVGCVTTDFGLKPVCPTGEDTGAVWGHPDYALTGADWSCAGRVGFDLDADSFESLVSLPKAEVQDEVQAVATTWTSAGTELGISIINDDASGLARDPTDLVNAIFVPVTPEYFSAIGEGEVFGADALAVANWTSDHYGNLEDCDIRVFTAVYDEDEGVSAPINWVAAESASGAPNTFDLKMTIVHEMGHCLGLGHYVGPEVVGETTPIMNWFHGLGDFVELADLDIEAMQFLYGESAS